jgi:hypothetical protein
MISLEYQVTITPFILDRKQKYRFIISKQSIILKLKSLKLFFRKGEVYNDIIDNHK